MPGDRTIFDEPHHQSLELLAIEALAAGNAASAFRFADRRCRILPQPEPHCYVLRGEASFQMGAKAAAIADIASALDIAPDNVTANRRMLAWADGPQRMRAAQALIGRERNFKSLHNPIQVLRADGQRNFASVTILDDTIEGWALWQDEAPLELTISDDDHSVSTIFELDPFHPLGDYGCAANFSVPRPKSTNAQFVVLSVAGDDIYSARVPANVREPTVRVHWPQAGRGVDGQVTVIVPVYGDYDATRDCLKSLLDELRAFGHRAILVNDATPEPRIAKYVAGLAAKDSIEVIVNARNLGFSGSVNRALARVPQGDVILLNADTIVPPGFINRLAASARSSADIGTLTPLSNNGEFASFPIPNTSNPLGSREFVERIDAIAAKANAGEVVDIPSGIGFCLYITRACLDRVECLSDAFGAGYLEDTDLCLRARGYGFRNVCATSVYVGHAGSKSFGQRKRALVVRNLGILERRYPKHRAECAAFVAADPLRAARSNIEYAAATTRNHLKLLITSSGAVSAIARERARAAAADSEATIILELHHVAAAATVTLKDASDGMPQSIKFDLASPHEFKTLVEFVKRLRPSLIEALDPASLPSQLIDALCGPKVPYDIYIADAGLLGPPVAQLCAVAAQPESAARVLPPGGTLAKHWLKIAGGARRILAPCPEAEAFAKRILPRNKIELVAPAAEKQSSDKRRRRRPDTRRLGFVPLRSRAQEQRLMSAIAHKFLTLRPKLSFTVIGGALDDIALMRGGNVFVTGAVNVDEFEDTVEAHDVSHLFFCTPRPLFGHPMQRAARSSGLPTAFFDWSMGLAKPNTHDLAIDPDSSLDELVALLDRWMAKR